MTNKGFISAVAYPGEEHLVLVRARAPGHLTEIFGSEEAVFFWHVSRKVDSQFAAR